MMAKGTVVDVRTPEEFAEGHVPGSVNIPLGELPARLAEVEALPRPLILCCRSGQRSQRALEWLQAQGVDGAENGGGWRDVLERGA